GLRGGGPARARGRGRGHPADAAGVRDEPCRVVDRRRAGSEELLRGAGRPGARPASLQWRGAGLLPTAPSLDARAAAGDHHPSRRLARQPRRLRRWRPGGAGAQAEPELRRHRRDHRSCHGPWGMEEAGRHGGRAGRGPLGGPATCVASGLPVPDAGLRWNDQQPALLCRLRLRAQRVRARHPRARLAGSRRQRRPARRHVRARRGAPAGTDRAGWAGRPHRYPRADGGAGDWDEELMMASGTDDLHALEALNRGYLLAAEKSDVAWYAEHLAEDYRATNPDGSFVDKAGFLARIGRPHALTNLRAPDVRIQRVGDMALIHASFEDTRPDGGHGRGRYTDIWQ